MKKPSTTKFEFQAGMDAIKAQCTMPRNPASLLVLGEGAASAQGQAGRGPLRAAATPANNMGVTGSPSHDLGEGDDGTELVEIFSKGKGRFEIIRIPKCNESVDSRCGFVDQFSFTQKVSEVSGPWLTDDDCVRQLSLKLLGILGYGVTTERDGKGLNFYERTYILGDNWGFVSIGGQRDTVLVQVSGRGVMAAKPGWEERLYAYLSYLSSARITRIDIAADFFDGSYSVTQARDAYLSGGFQLTNCRPKCEARGDWENDNLRGRTFYVGSRDSGKLFRVYEKGLQLGRAVLLDRFDDLSKWVRCEVEWHNSGRVIPLETLIHPGKYLAGSYPAMGFLSQIQSRIMTVKKTVKTIVEAGKQILRNQYGRWLYALTELFGLDVIQDLIIPELPRSIDFHDYRLSASALVPKYRETDDGLMLGSLVSY